MRFRQFLQEQEKSPQHKGEFLWHGSREKINGPLEPRPAKDVGGAPGSNMTAVYAGPSKEFAIMMGLAEKDAFTSVFHHLKPLQLVLFKGELRIGKKVYLYKLPKEQFKDAQTGVGEWVATVPVMPIGVEEVNVNDYLHLVRPPTEEDLKSYHKYMPKGSL